MSISFLLIIWFLLYLLIGHALILPSPISVMKTLGVMLIKSHTYTVILSTAFRLIVAIVISALLGISLSFLSYFNETMKHFVKPYVTILRTIPVISIIVILLIILGFSWTPYVITFFMVFPIIYQGTLHGLETINPDLIDVIKLEQKHILKMIFGFYTPHISSSIFLAFLQSFGLGIKVLVMAEYLAQTNLSMGSEIYLAKINLAYDLVFAWTIILIVISISIEYFVQKAIQKNTQEEPETKVIVSMKENA
jgi:NitT/TauT family transport system permease protein